MQFRNLFEIQSSKKKLKGLGIHTTEQLIQLTSAQLIEKLLSLKKPYQHMSIQAIGRKLCDNGLFLARDEEATRRLITYDPLTDDKSPENASASEAPAAETKPGAQTSAAADPLSDNDTNPSSFEAVLRKIGASLDDLQRDALALSHISFSANFKDANGKGYRITINEMNLSAVG